MSPAQEEMIKTHKTLLKLIWKNMQGWQITKSQYDELVLDWDQFRLNLRHAAMTDLITHKEPQHETKHK